jgi:hypothetical protein
LEGNASSEISNRPERENARRPGGERGEKDLEIRKPKPPAGFELPVYLHKNKMRPCGPVRSMSEKSAGDGVAVDVRALASLSSLIVLTGA